jgi:hypothetical protein
MVATCAAHGRGIWAHILPSHLFYVGVDLLILLGIARDLIVNRTVHRVYLFVVPLFILGQTIMTYIAYHKVPFWLRIAHAIIG